jgi:ArsR family transcriptional regulator
MTFEDASAITRALSNPKRLQIVDLISFSELCACELQDYFSVTQPTLSHDMRQLVDTGVVTARREGKWMYYALNEGNLREYYECLGRIFFDTEHCICRLRKTAETCRV